jgi:UDP-2,4-diacetamido-2,4,6-trideoxy-beta-L-altropyranose hydrolase
MHLYIRADADSQMGTGHIMRCIALAQAWQDHGGEVTFISRCDSEPLQQRIKNEGFKLIPITSSCPDPSDLNDTLFIFKKDTADQNKWIVLDGYHFVPDYQKAIRDAGIHLLVIDDMNHLPCYHADILLNQNINAPALTYHCDPDTILLMGTQYVLLRRDFLKYQDFKRQSPDRAKNILITLGGADPDNITLKAIEALKLLNEPDIVVRIVVGPANPHQDTLRRSLFSAQYQAALLINPPHMPELMAWADMAVSAGGSTCWELAFMGVPSLTVVTAENQQNIANELERAEIFKTVGHYKAMNMYVLVKELSAFMREKTLRQKKIGLGRQIVDGKGSKTIVRMLSEQSVAKH